MPVLLAAAVLLGTLHGVVVRSPTMPVCIVGKPCSAPAAGVVLVFSRAGHVAARVRTDAKGRYTVRLAAGDYAVRLTTRSPIGRGLEPQTAHVVAGATRRLDFTIDTGIR